MSDNISPTSSGKSSKYAATYTEQVELETNSWAGSAQSTGILGESGSKSDKSAGVTSSAGGKGSSKSSKSDTVESVVNVATSNGWSGSAQEYNTVSTATSSGKSSKMEYSNNSYAMNGGDSKVSTVSVSSSSKGGKGYGTSEAAHVEIKYVAISKPQSTNDWQSDGWQP